MNQLKEEIKSLFLKKKLNKLTKEDKRELAIYKELVPELKYKRNILRILSIINLIDSKQLQLSYLKLTLCQHGITKYKINSNYSIDAYQDVHFNYKQLIKLPFNFNKVTGGFYCYYNYLITLKGAPKIVEGDFDCSHNQLITLKGGPKRIKGDFICYDNKLTNLEWVPNVKGKLISDINK